MEKKMNLPRDGGANMEEDKISNLPDDIIHRIFSFLDMTYIVRTCILSPRWKNTWASTPYINLNSGMFKSNHEFKEFVKHVLTHRNNRIEVLEAELRFDGQTDQRCVEDIVNYANLHNARKVTMIWFPKFIHELPQYFFSSFRTLNHLTLGEDPPSLRIIYLPESAWDFPALETLTLSYICLRLCDPRNKSVDLFSKCVNLKDLTLRKLVLDKVIFNVCAPQLLNLTITDCLSFPEVFNVVAPQLKNLTTSLNAPYNYTHGGPLFLPLSTYGSFNSLENVNLSFVGGKKEQRHGSQLLNLFQIICKAKFLNLDVDIMNNLSNSCLLNQLSCPFNNLKCLKINAKSLKQNEHIPTIPVQMKNYFLQNSPSATFIVESTGATEEIKGAGT
uniref:putative F-box/FBD/LRR-repeat protein At5g56810 n=1 Tax=Erigeron canadensis TaxID=72917 RepID=UPI001CB985C6|nr:putative F-box/FBD/LRR-repeat protein At5g56810 [Erigeron canadensis]